MMQAQENRRRPPPLHDVYQALFAQWGPQYWWPAHSRLEMMIGAILTQNTAWTNVERAIRRLKKEKAIDLSVLQALDHDTLAEWIRPAGYFNVKSRRLKSLVNMIEEDFEGSLRCLFALKTDSLRQKLLSVNGIGPETADCIILYAGKQASFVIDAYTRRFLLRHDWITLDAKYDDMSKLMMDCIPCDIQLYNEYHALIVRLGKEHCRPQPRCNDCPLRKWLPGQKRTNCK